MIDHLHSETRKALSLRQWWAIGLAPLVAGLLSATVSVPVLRRVPVVRDDDELAGATGLLAMAVAILVACVAAAVFAALHTGNEYRHRTATWTFAGRRDEALGAQLALVTAVGLVYTLVAVVSALPVLAVFGGGALMLDVRLFAMVGLGLLMAVLWSLIGSGLASATTRSTGTAVAILVWFVVAEFAVVFVLAKLGAESVTHVLPVSATVGALVDTATGDATDVFDALPPWPGALLAVGAWAAAAAAAGWILARRRDL